MLPAGCVAPQAVGGPTRLTGPGTQPASVPAERAEATERIQRNPLGFLHEVFGRSDALEQYQLTFYRQERLGLIPRLGPMEKITASFRRDPFSVKFVWDEPSADYYESVYVAGQNGDKLLVRERKGVLGLPPQTRALKVGDPVALGASKNPITDFGLARVARRTLVPFENPEVAKVSSIRYQGIVDLEPMHRPAYYVRIERPPAPGLRYTHQDFYVDVATLLPAGSDLFLPSGQLDARYRYADVDSGVKLSAADFQLTPPRPAR